MTRPKQSHLAVIPQGEKTALHEFKGRQNPERGKVSSLPETFEKGVCTLGTLGFIRWTGHGGEDRLGKMDSRSVGVRHPAL